MGSAVVGVAVVCSAVVVDVVVPLISNKTISNKTNRVITYSHVTAIESVKYPKHQIGEIRTSACEAR